MPEALSGYRLDEPRLRFDYENRQAVSGNPYDGLRTLGPYDLAERRKAGRRTIRTLLIGRANQREAMNAARAALTEKRLGRLHDVFDLRVVAELEVEPSSISGEAQAYRATIQEWLLSRMRPEVDLAIVLHDDEEHYRSRARAVSPYYASKAALLRAGIPTQSICYKHLAPGHLHTFRSFYLTNILIACYAKIGGTPWVIQAPDAERPEVTLGVATTAVVGERGIERLVGISTIFRENGAFALWGTTAPQGDWAAYETALERSVIDAIDTFESREGRRVRRVACHVSGKRAGRREVEAMRRALARYAGRDIVADLVHVSDESLLWLFDGSDTSHRPMPGIVTELRSDGSSVLLHVDGRTADGAKARFPVRPLRLTIHSGIPDDGGEGIYQHLYDLRWMSWRGVRAASRPVSVDYPQRMAKLLAFLHAQEDVEAIEILPQLTSKAWFL